MLTLVVQAGGESRRMGQDKGLLPFLGQPLIARVVERMTPHADRAMIISNNPAAYEFLGLPVFPDVRPGIGALGGLYSALSLAEDPLVAVIACDMPFASPQLLAIARDLLVQHPHYDVALPHSSKGIEPFHAVYRRETCLEPVRRALETGKRRMISWLHEVQVNTISPEVVQAFDPQELTFWNVNTPEEFARAEAIARTQMM